MSTERTVLIAFGALVVVVGGMYVYNASRPPLSTSVASGTSVPGALLEDPAARGQAERTAWVSMVSSLFGAVGAIANTQSNQTRVTSGTSVPPSTNTQSSSSSGTDWSSLLS